MAHEKKNAQFSARISGLEAEIKTTLERLTFLTKVPRIKSVGGGKKGVNKSNCPALSNQGSNIHWWDHSSFRVASCRINSDVYSNNDMRSVALRVAIYQNASPKSRES